MAHQIGVPPLERTTRGPTGASLAVIILATLCFCAVMLLHILRNEIHPISRVMSDYANGSNGLIMTIAFYAFGLASIALGFRLTWAIERRASTRLVSILLAVAGASLIAAGIFEVERALVPDTIQEMIHSYATMAAFIMVITSMLVFSYATKGDARWSSFRWVSTTLAVVAAIAAMASPFSADTGWSGAVQRVLGFAVLAWFLLTAMHVRTKPFSTT
ncbi:MAG TPA: DUF998 domain-containing protein [Actinomycetota bacterium]|nr:DUF998 domain-containing protein [Actinomycetota bacterium]